MPSFCKSLLVVGFVYVMCAASAFGSAANIYITASGQPTGNCTASVQTPAFFNSAANWGTGAAQIGPGTTVLICGTFTGAAGATEFTFQGSGTSGSPVTLLFDTGTKLVSPYWSGSYGAIGCNSKSYIRIDGGTNGSIANSANGTNQTSHQQSYGVGLGACTHSEVKNLTIQNIYINNGSSSSATDVSGQNTACIAVNGASTGSMVHDNTLSQCKTGVLVSADANADASGDQIYNNNINDIDWGINFGGGDAGDTMLGVLIHDNTITNWTNWQFPTNALHTDGIILFNYATGSPTLTASVYNNHIYGDLGVGSPTGFIYCAQNASCAIYNNLLVNTGHLINGIIWFASAGGCGSKVYNNTIVGINSNDIAITVGTTPCTAPGKLTIANNIITSVGVGFGTYNTAGFTSDVASSNYNVWRNARGASPQMAYNLGGSSTMAGFTGWKTAGFDAGSSSADPKLGTNYYPGTGSSAINLGSDLATLGLSTLDRDMAQYPRPGTSGSSMAAGSPWDAGAFNHDDVPAPVAISAVVK